MTQTTDVLQMRCLSFYYEKTTAHNIA